ncbi:hypothetical protein [Xanthobacter autotrophicus]|uniref:hypothetical protein n=1 Tax=Xanthobacter autotrophicus TaxID=280 RepID=UPI003726AF80
MKKKNEFDYNRLEDLYKEIIPDSPAEKVPPEQIRFRRFRAAKRVETVTTYGAYERPL